MMRLLLAARGAIDSLITEVQQFDPEVEVPNHDIDIDDAAFAFGEQDDLDDPEAIPRPIGGYHSDSPEWSG